VWEAMTSRRSPKQFRRPFLFACVRNGKYFNRWTKHRGEGFDPSMGSNSFALKVRIWLDQVSTTCDSGWVRSPQAGSVLFMQSFFAALI
jgi:hypothetical protein